MSQPQKDGKGNRMAIGTDFSSPTSGKQIPGKQTFSDPFYPLSLLVSLVAQSDLVCIRPIVDGVLRGGQLVLRCPCLCCGKSQHLGGISASSASGEYFIETMHRYT